MFAIDQLGVVRPDGGRQLGAVAGETTIAAITRARSA
jgi:hypothetical protein